MRQTSMLSLGDRFDYLTASQYMGLIGSKGHVWKFICDCGGERVAPGSKVRKRSQQGFPQHCGCKKGSNVSKGKTKHGKSYTSIHVRWMSILSRCNNPSHSQWKDYGGRGISVCDEWFDFNNFYRDMGDAPEGKEIDRIDNNKGYSKDNCRWVTPKENNNNRRNNLPFNVEEISKKTGLARSTIYNRHRKGWSIDQLMQPRLRRSPQGDRTFYGLNEKHAQKSFKRLPEAFTSDWRS